MKRTLLIICISCLSSFLYAQELTDSLQNIIEQAQQDLNIASISAAINFEDESIWAGVTGMAGDNIPLTPEHLFPIGSTSKILTTACIMKLIEQGEFGLEDTLGYLFPNTNPNINGQISLKQLLNHTSGLFNYTSHPDFFVDIQEDFTATYEPIDLLDIYVDDPDFEPGADWSYSNTNYVILGLIIESFSNMEYHEAVRSYLLDPLGLDDINIFPYEPYTLELAHLYQDPAGTGSIDIFNVGVQMDSFLSSAWAAGAYTATPSDLSIFMKAVYDGTLLNQNSLDLLTEELFYIGGNIDYGLGTMLYEIKPDTSLIGHGGDILYSTFAFYDPINDLSLTIHANDMNIGSTDLLEPLQSLWEVAINIVVEQPTAIAKH